MIVNAEEVPLLSRGDQHYQRLLGYTIVRLRVIPRPSDVLEMLRRPWVRIVALGLLAAAVMVTVRCAIGPSACFGVRAIVWVAGLVAIRRASWRAGPATLTALVAAATYPEVQEFRAPPTAVAWISAGLTLDLLLALVPRLTWGSLGVTPAAVAAAVVAVAVSEVVRSPSGASHSLVQLSTWGQVVVCGAVAGTVGWWVGGLTVRLIPIRRPWTLAREIAFQACPDGQPLP